MYPCCGCALLWSIQPVQLLFLSRLPPIPCFSTAFNTHRYPLPSHLMLCDMTDALSFSFPLSLSSIESLYCYKHVLHLSLYMIMLVYECMFTFHEKKACSFCVSDPG
jgi:hypothetical protein